MDFSPTPIKLSFHLAWNFFTKNKMLSLFIILALFGMALLSMIPILGLVFSMMLMAMFFSLQVTIGKLVYQSESLENYYSGVAKLTLKEALVGRLGVAFGYFVGFFVVEIALFIVLGILAVIFGASDAFVDLANGLEPASAAGLGMLIFVFGLIMLFISYIFPIVVGGIYKEETFGGAFKALFKMFSPQTWKASLNLNYFLLVIVWMLTIFAIGLLATFSFATLVLIPVGIFLFYFLALFSSAACAVSYEITMEASQEQNTTISDDEITPN